MVQRLRKSEILDRLQALSDWVLQGETIQCLRTFKNFVEAIDFVNKLVEPAETAKHHPDIEISYNKVKISLTTHDVGGLTEKDFDLAKELGHNAHRFSIEWARIEPEEGVFDEEEIEHYRKVLSALHARDIEPFITLWHFTLPTWFAESGGFERKDAPEIFARYCKKVTESFGDLCTHYATINEPNVWATHGYLYGAWPPFKRGRIFWKKIGKEDGTSERTGAKARFRHFFTYFKVASALTEAHIQAYKAIKSVRPTADVGIVKHVHFFDADEKWYNKLRARIMAHLQTLRFLNRVQNHLDSIGLNYYRATKYGDNKDLL